MYLTEYPLAAAYSNHRRELARIPEADNFMSMLSFFNIVRNII